MNQSTFPISSPNLNGSFPFNPTLYHLHPLYIISKKPHLFHKFIDVPLRIHQKPMASCFPSTSEEIEFIPEKTLLRKRLTEDYLSGPDSKRSRNVRLLTGAYYLPKKNKEKPLGEDAYFISDDEQTVGVADGVGGWAEFGIDSGIYARELMDNARDFVLEESVTGVDPVRVLDHAFANSAAEGASTVCIITLKDNSLHAVNLGDSGFLVIRDGEIKYRSPVQQSRFNCPFQLGVECSHTPNDADEIVFEVELGDVLVAATDGLLDNLFDFEIEDIVNSSVRNGDLPEVVAYNLVQEARKMSLRRDCITPFTFAAFDDGRDEDSCMGGKYDDVTVIVGHIY